MVLANVLVHACSNLMNDALYSMNTLYSMNINPGGGGRGYWACQFFKYRFLFLNFKGEIFFFQNMLVSLLKDVHAPPPPPPPPPRTVYQMLNA